MRSRFVGLLLAAILSGIVPSAGATQAVDAQKIRNLKSQQTSIENRIADLQSRVDDAYAGKTYCSSEERQEDLRKLREIQREIIALRNEYAEFKRGFITLASTPTAGPQFDAAGIHPDERSYWTADDNALSKLRESALAKANRVEQAPIRDCNEKKAAPTTAPVTETPPAKKSEEPPSTTKPPPTGPTAPLGGPLPGTGCTEKERHDRILRIQDEILRLEAELIPIDGTTPEGRARQLQLRREIDRLAELMKSDCPPRLGGSQAPSPKQAVEPPKGPTAPIGGTGNILIPLNPFAEFEDDADDAMKDLDDAMDDCDEDAVKKLIPKLEELAKRARQIAKAAQAAGKFSKVDPLRASLLAKELEEALADAKKFKCLRIKPSNMSNDWPQYRLCQGSGWSGNWGGMPPDAKTAFRSCTTPGTEDSAWQLLSIHNREREAVGALPLRWNIQLQTNATAYAQQLARTGQLTHAPREGRGIERENLGQGRIGWSPGQIVTKEWTSEKAYFRAGVFPNICEGDWSQCAHYSQMIWPTTTDLGCGWATGSGFEWVVCRYSPGGNKDGKRVGYMDVARAAAPAHSFSGGPLLFEKVYSPVLKANRPANPDKLEFGDEAVHYWGVFEYARDFGYSDWAFGTLDKLKFYAQTAREHSAEERSKGNSGASEQYAAMARQISERVASGEADMKTKGYKPPLKQ